jgi:hypothetical protein
MELAVVILGAIAFLLSLAAIALSVWNTIHIQAQRLSTHTVIPVSPSNTSLDSIEKELDKIVKGAGGNQEDLNRNLFQTGLDPEDLV